ASRMDRTLSRTASDAVNHRASRCVSFFFSSRRRHTRWPRDWSSDVCSSDLGVSAGSALRASDENEIAGDDGRGKSEGDGCLPVRSEERRVGKECRSRWWAYHQKKKRRNPPTR